MGFVRQITTLCRKNLLIVAWRSWFPTALRAIILPIAFIIFLGYVREFFLPPSLYGVGSPSQIRDLLTQVFPSPPGRRTRVAFSNNGLVGGQIDDLINAMSGPLRDVGADVQILSSDLELSRVCRSSLRGTSKCYAAAGFYESPTEGNATQWTYTITADFALGFEAFVNRDNNDAQMFSLPFQHYIDSHIANLTGAAFPTAMDEIPFTVQTKQQREDRLQGIYMGALSHYLAAAFFLAMCGITFHLPGFIASEREIGMSQLIDSMIPHKHQIFSQIARLLAAHLAFDLIYLPSWLSVGAVISSLTFVRTSHGLVVGFHLLTGLALCSFSTFGASFFRRSQLSGISVLIVSLIMAVVAQLAPIPGSAAVYVFSFLFPSAAYTYFMTDVAGAEGRLQAFSLTTTSAASRWPVPGYVFIVALVLQIIIYPILATWVEQARFGTTSKGRDIRAVSHSSDAAIKVTNFSKHYNSRAWNSSRVVQAVNNLNLTVLNGETMVLLGANGSGKSTTLDTISGIINSSGGLIEVDGSGGIGLCPQKNVLWSNLTVREHVWIFEQLKANPLPGDSAAIDALIRGCDLDGKFKKRAGALSGGQKRKLQLAMAFAGGSRVCCIDEVSSGLDPLSRRKIWDILIQERGRRTFLLTTHALDEADALADHITIMSKGHLKAQGSVVELKTRYGGGYRVHVPGSLQPETIVKANAAHTITPVETIFQVHTSADAARLANYLRSEGIEQINVNGPSMEDVFLQVAEEGKEELFFESEQSPTASLKDGIRDTDSERRDTQLAKGEGRSALGQIWVLFRKRVTILKRNYIPYACVVIIPLITAGLGTYFLNGFGELTCAYLDIAQIGGFINFQSQGGFGQNYRFGPSTAFSARQWPFGYVRLLERNRVILQDSFSTFRDLRRPNSTGRATSGGAWLGATDYTTPTLAYRIDEGLWGPVFAKQIMDSYIMGTNLDVRFSTFVLPISSAVGDSLQLIIYFGLAMCAYPAFFALYPTFERLRKIRALHYSNGIHASSLWMAYALFDFVFVLAASIGAIALLVGITNVWFAPGYLFVVFVLYGLSSMLLSYVISLLASSQLAAFAFAAGTQAVFLLIYFVGYLGLLSFSLPDDLPRDLDILQFTLGLVTPSGNLLRALLLTLNQSQLICRDQSFVSYPGEITAFGGPILYLLLQIFALFTILVLYDSGRKPQWLVFGKKKHTAADQEKMAESAVQEVLAEVARTENSQDALRILHLDKSFGRETAVNDLTFGVQHGEVFALLGPNGAGKSTTISLIRGDIRPSTKHSDIMVEDVSVIHNRTAARRNLGVCPQFDAIDRMTVREHLSFYAQACGVSDVRRNVESVILATGLAPFKNRMADELSGGNKRKLSLGISIIGNPSVLLLDEPSSGMDAVSRRIMWKLLSSVKQGRSLVLTTHSMEEASALGDRAGIMAKKMLAVGTTQHLRSVHGNGYYVHLVHRKAPSVTMEEEGHLQRWIQHTAPGAISIGGSMLHGQLRYHVPATTGEGSNTVAQPVSMSRMLELLERDKNDLGIGFYSVSPTTLEDVFLNIVGGHGVVDMEEQTVRTTSVSRRLSDANVFQRIKSKF